MADWFSIDTTACLGGIGMRFVRRLIGFSFAIGLVACAISSQVAADTWAFVSAATDKRVVALVWDAQQAKLVERCHLTLPGEPGALAWIPERQLLMVALRAEGRLASLHFDPQVPELTLINHVPAGDDPAHLAVDPSGQFLVTAYYVAGKVSVHRIGPEGRLSTDALQEVLTADKAHAVVWHPRHPWIYVPHTGSERIEVFRWRESSTPLTQLNQLRVTTADHTGPRHALWTHSSNQLLVNNEQANSITLYQLDDVGWLSARGSAPTLPSDWQQGNATAEIRRHPERDLFYVSNRGHNSVAVIQLKSKDSEEPALQLLTTIPTEAVPRSFDIDPTGAFLVVAGEQSGNLAVHRLSDDGTNAAASSQRIALGERLWCVLLIEIP